jgi:hypothetical protein
MNQKTRPHRQVCCTQLVLYLGRCSLSTLLIIRQHHGEASSKGEVIPCEVQAFAAFVRLDCTDARPDLLAQLVLAHASVVVEDKRWCIWHRNIVSVTNQWC